MIFWFKTGCSHSKVNETTKEEVWYTRSNNSDKLNAYKYKYIIDTCSMCGKESRKCIDEIRDENLDIDKSSLSRYKYALKFRIMEI